MTEFQISNLKSQILRLACLALVISLLVITPTKAQVPPPDRRFGAADVANHDPAIYAMSSTAAVEAGVAWERILLYWSELQREGPGDWNGYHVPDEWLTQAAAADREVVALLKNTPAWATDGQPGCGVPRGLYLPVDDPGNLWSGFVRKTVEIYKGRISHWIIWNEPDIAPDSFGAEWCGTIEDYYQLLKVAYLAAHQVDPDATIHLAGLTRWHDPTYLQRFLAVATSDPTGPEHGYYFDVVSLHIYFQPETIPDIFSETYAAMAAYSISKPIWLNETNAASNSDPPYWELPEANFNVTLEEQAGFLLQAFAVALNSGAERIAVYKWVDNPPRPGEEPNGIIRLDGSRRPAFDAYKLITTHYAGAVSASEDRQPLYTVVTLDLGTRTTRVLWARTQAPATVSLPAQSAQARLIDQAGAEQTVTPVGGQYTVTLPGARCADKRGCIIGGFTYLLVEESAGEPLPTATAETPTASSPVDTPIPPTATPAPTDTPAPTLTATPTLPPTATSVPLPVFTSTPMPTQTPLPTPTPTPLPTVQPTEEPTIWPLLVGLAVVFLLAAIIGSMFRYREGTHGHGEDW
ncbi:MAG: hypothetical protein JW918_18575 [Anaerolineae bacterium]|nr:hypothetical protein [Anaerolineae bacterium]